MSFAFLCVHTPRKAYRGEYPTKIVVVHAQSVKTALEKFTPFYQNEPFIKYMKKPYAVPAVQAHYLY